VAVGIVATAVGAVGAAYFGWLVCMWYLINAAFYWTGPVYSSLVIMLALLIASLALLAFGVRAVLQASSPKA
jgi:hypothetical protein